MNKMTDENISIKETLQKGDELNISDNVITSIVGLVTEDVYKRQVNEMRSKTYLTKMKLGKEKREENVLISLMVIKN